MPKAIYLLPFLPVLLLSQNALADACWQALFFEQRTLAYIAWGIPLGLLIEWPAVWLITFFPLGKSLGVTVCMNAVSFFLGIILQAPVAFTPGVIGTIAIFAIAILGSTFIEGFVINRFRKATFNRKTFPLLLTVNAITGGLTLAVVLLSA